MTIDPHLLVRGASLYLAVLATGFAWAWRRPSQRAVAAAVLASAWNLPALLVLHLVAARAGWWVFDAEGGLLLGMPVDLWLTWAWCWGALPILAAPRLPIVAVTVLALCLDLLLMPLAAPVVQLGPRWLVGELLGLLACFVPAQCLARWTLRDERLTGRAVLQAIAFTGFVLFVVPAIVIEGAGNGWMNPLERPAWQTALLVQFLAVPALLGLTALQEFVQRGAGTPVPFDPPRRLVTSGIYAYVRNPMQLSGATMLALLGVALGNAWVSAAGVMAHLYSAGLAGWDEDEDLRRRFGDGWTAYKAAVRCWIPRWRPWQPPAARPAALYVADSCAMCREVRDWLEHRGVRGLSILPAESHPSDSLGRMTYEPADGSRPAAGVEALARALEHTHLGWAAIGWALRLPGICAMAQLVIDASGGEPRPIARTRTRCSQDPRRRTSCSRA